MHSRIDVIKIKFTQTRVQIQAPARVFNNRTTSHPDGRRRLTTEYAHTNTSRWLSLPPRVDHMFDFLPRAALCASVCVCVCVGVNDQNWLAYAQSGWTIILYKILQGPRYSCDPFGKHWLLKTKNIYTIMSIKVLTSSDHRLEGWRFRFFWYLKDV